MVVVVVAVAVVAPPKNTTATADLNHTSQQQFVYHPSALYQVYLDSFSTTIALPFQLNLHPHTQSSTTSPNQPHSQGRTTRYPAIGTDDTMADTGTEAFTKANQEYFE